MNHINQINDYLNIINVFQKNAVCLLHKKRYSKYCLKCKLNLCELCENHNNHYIEIFKEIYPLKEEIAHFNNEVNKFKNYEIKKVNEIRTLIIKSINENITNYNYINNIKNIIRSISLNYDYIRQKDIKYTNWKF